MAPVSILIRYTQLWNEHMIVGTHFLHSFSIDIIVRQLVLPPQASIKRELLDLCAVVGIQGPCAGLLVRTVISRETTLLEIAVAVYIGHLFTKSQQTCWDRGRDCKFFSHKMIFSLGGACRNDFVTG